MEKVNSKKLGTAAEYKLDCNPFQEDGYSDKIRIPANEKPETATIYGVRFQSDAVAPEWHWREGPVPKCYLDRVRPRQIHEKLGPNES